MKNKIEGKTKLLVLPSRVVPNAQSTPRKAKLQPAFKLGYKVSLLGILSLFFSFFCVNAYAYAQKIQLKKGSLSYRNLFQEINRQTGYHYLWTAKLTDPQMKIAVAFNNRPLTDALHEISEKYPLAFEVSDNLIKVKDKPLVVQATNSHNIPAIAASVEENLQQVIRGKVTNQLGESLVGVTISVAGKKEGTVTDVNGEFNLPASALTQNLVISYLGYVSQTLPAQLRMGTIVLTPSQSTIEETTVRVNTGYQNLSRERMTGSFSHISGEQLESKLTTDLKSALEGQAAGVVIDKSGNIEIRGVSTFNAQKTPLVVVDGYPIEGGIEDINPMNIASITVLKDGVAASIYGSRAANGVIVITTKSGGNSKPRVSYSGFVSIIAKPDLNYLNRASSSDFIDAEIDLFNENPNGPSTLSTSVMSRVTYLLMQVREKKISESEAMAEINALRNIDGKKQIEDAFFRKKIINQHNLGIAGGSEEYNYNIAVNYQGTRENLVNNVGKRIIFDLKNEWKPFSFLTAGASANFNVDNTEASYMLVNNSSGPSYIGNHFSNLTSYSGNSLLRPYTDLWAENGDPASIWGISQYKVKTYQNTPGMKAWDYHPMQDIYDNQFDTKKFTARITGYVRAQLLEGLTAEVGGNWVRGSSLIKGVQGADAFAVRVAYNDATSKANKANHYFPDGAVVNEYRNISESWTMRSQLNYARDFQGTKHRLNALFGNEIRKITFDNNQLATRLGYNPSAGSFIPVNIKDYTGGLYTTDMLFPSTFGGITNGEFKYGDNRFVSWYANSSYEYDNRFILSGSMRLDLTNFFGTDKQYRYKPLWSLGGTYKLSNEKFWESSLVNKLFIRGSYGINGNISLNNGPYLILAAGQYTPSTGGVSYSIASPPNNQLRWEKTVISNIGIDFGLFNNRVEGSLDYYNKKSSDLLANDAIDPTLGFTSLVKNVGEMSNHGIELSLNMRIVNQDNFKWSIAPNLAYNYNKVNHYNVNRQYPSSYTSPQGILSAGYPAAAIYGYRFAGLNDKGQTQIYNTANEKVLIANAAISDVVYQGTFRPKWDLALTNRVKYEDWSLSFMFIAKLGHKYRKDAFVGSNIQNRHVGERWRKPGDEAHTIYPVLQSWNMDMFDFPYVDALVGNASYAKLRDVTLSYDLSKWTKSLRIANAQLYLQGRNLFRITAKGVDIDPETSEVNLTNGTGTATEQGYTNLPLPREFFIGLRIGL